ncbi:MAG: threonine synthase [Pseudomonadota bacterium]|nr:threonine synthase [Pseudomonadota bacterium]
MKSDSLQYVSTRGHKKKLEFHDVIFEGLAPDGGLYIPEYWPTLNKDIINSFSSKNYTEIAHDVLSPFLDNTINENELRLIIESAYRCFDSDEITPLTKISNDEYLLELHHGPTYAFKDIAMQFIARLMDFYLSRDNTTINILGATSGDTGAAAIEGFSKTQSTNIFILHPHNKITDIQRKFMTTVKSKNVFNIAIEGNFDDCQKIIKSIFADNNFKKNNKLTAVNSINWARIMCQIVYYFYCVSRLPSNKRINFSVPTGNFGDIFAGYIASKMGLIINNLVIATNENDILARTLKDGQHTLKEVLATSSPSIDIQISSNFERLIYDVTKDSEYIKKIMDDLISKKNYVLKTDIISVIKKHFSAYSINQDEVTLLINSLFTEKKITIDPHTAVGLAASRKNKSSQCIDVILSTAHPTKFKDTVTPIINDESYVTDRVRQIINLDETMTVLKNDEAVVRNFILENI